VTAGVVHDVATSQGRSRLHCFAAVADVAGGRDSQGARGTVLLGHGAGGGVDAEDLAALTALTQRGWVVVLLEQPWRVAGRRIAVAPPRLDEATEQMLAAVAGLTEAPRPWVLGGRSAGARVACRLRAHAQALCLLAFPLTPPQRGTRAQAPRTEELLAPVRDRIPTLVLQGRGDRFGGPMDIADAVDVALPPVEATSPRDTELLRVRGYPGDHGPSRDLGLVVEEAGSFLDALP